ncbi:MAG: hypothetical protein PHW51_02545, partial [Candidatus Omnitrophica bacterium]|nr:hypothetical protein [Candidatus Omnitrophota bacterium]
MRLFLRIFLTLTLFIVIFGAVYAEDTTPPMCIGLYINGGASYAKSTPATIWFFAYDPQSKVTEMSFSNDNITWSAPEPYRWSKNIVLPSGDGTKTIYAKAKDAAGNWSSPINDSIILDTTPPMCIGLYINGGASYAKSTPATIWFFAYDPQSKVTEMSF